MIMRMRDVFLFFGGVSSPVFVDRLIKRDVCFKILALCVFAYLQIIVDVTPKFQHILFLYFFIFFCISNFSVSL